MEGPFIVKNNNIIHIPSNCKIDRPSVLYDNETFTILKIGNYSLCYDYFNLLMSRGFPDTQKITLLEFTVKSINETCETMNNVINCTGYIERIIKEERHESSNDRYNKYGFNCS